MLRFILIISLSALCGASLAQSTVQPLPFSHQTVGQGPDLILIPGLASSAEVWSETVDSLKADFTCHLISLSGFAGEVPMDVSGGFLPKIKSALIAYIEKQADGKATLMGHSLGGFLSMDIASEAPELVEKVIIVDSYPFYSAGMNPMATEESAKAMAKQFKASMLAMPDSQFAQQQRMTMPVLTSPADKIELAYQWSLKSDRATMAQAMYELMTTDLREEVGKIACPVLVFGSWYAGKDYGLSSEIVQANYQAQFAKTAKVQIKMAPTARHFVMWDQPQWFLQEVVKFIQ